MDIIALKLLSNNRKFTGVQPALRLEGQFISSCDGFNKAFNGFNGFFWLNDAEASLVRLGEGKEGSEEKEEGEGKEGGRGERVI